MRKGSTWCALLVVLVLGVVACEPPDGSELPDYVGVWEGSDLPTPGFHDDAIVTIGDDGTYESLLYDVGGTTLQSGSSRGTYTAAGGVMTNSATEVYDGVAWQPSTKVSEVPYTVVGDTLTMSFDFTRDGVPDEDWAFTRQ